MKRHFIAGSILYQFSSLSFGLIIPLLFSPAEFGIYILNLSFIAIANTFSSLRFELLIINEEDINMSLCIAHIGLWILVLSSSFLLGCMYLLHSIGNFQFNFLTKSNLVLIFLAILVLGISQILIQLAIRFGDALRVSYARSFQAFLTLISAIIFALFFNSMGSKALITAYIIGHSGVVILLNKYLFKTLKLLFCRGHFQLILIFKDKFKRAFYATSSSFLASISSHFQNFVVLFLLGESQLGVFSLALRLESSLVVSIAQPASQYYLSKMSKANINNKSILNACKKDMYVVSAILSIASLVAFSSLSKFTSAISVGEEYTWLQSLTLFLMLIPLLFVHIPSSALSSIFVNTGKNIEEFPNLLLFTILRLAPMFLMVFISQYFNIKFNLESFTALFCFAACVAYVTYTNRMMRIY